MFLVDKNIRIAASKLGFALETLRNHGVSYQWISLVQGQIHDKNCDAAAISESMLAWDKGAVQSEIAS